jgi:hypothetical protein
LIDDEDESAASGHVVVRAVRWRQARRRPLSRRCRDASDCAHGSDPIADPDFNF